MGRLYRAPAVVAVTPDRMRYDFHVVHLRGTSRTLLGDGTGPPDSSNDAANTVLAPWGGENSAHTSSRSPRRVVEQGSARTRKGMYHTLGGMELGCCGGLLPLFVPLRKSTPLGG